MIRILYYLARHDLAVDAANVDAGIQAGFIVGVDNVATKGLVCTNATIVWSLKQHAEFEIIQNKHNSLLIMQIMNHIQQK